MAINVPNIPYQPAPDVDPQGATPRLNVRADPDSFGANIGQAMRGLGGAMGQVGDELFSSAMKMQDIKNETEANNASTKYMIDAGTAQEQFQSLQGDAPHAQLQAHLDGLNKMRQDARGSLTNDAVKRAFDNQTLGEFRQLTIRSSGHAAAQLKQANVNGNKATQQVYQRDIEKGNLSEEAFQDKRQKIMDLITANGRNQNQRDIEIRNEQEKMETELALSRAKGIAVTDVQGGMDYLNAHRDIVPADKYAQAHAQLQGKLIPIVVDSAAKNTNANRDTVGFPAGSTTQDLSTYNGAVSPVTNSVLVYGMDNPDADVHVEPGEDNRNINILTNDPEGTKAAFDKAIGRLGMPITSEIKDGKVSITLAGEYDLSTAPAMPQEGQGSRDARTAAYLKRAHPDIENIGEHGELGSARLGARMHAQKAQQQRDDENTVLKAIDQLGGYSKVTDPRMIAEQLKTMQGSPDAWDNLPQARKNAITRNLGKTAALQDNINEVIRMDRLSNAELYNMDPHDIASNTLLTEGTQKRFLHKQAQIIQNAGNENPMTAEAMKMMAPYLGAYDSDQKQSYKEWLQDALIDEARDTKKAPTRDRIMQIGRELLSTKTTDGLFGTGLFSSTETFFQQPVQQKEVNDIMQDQQLQYKLGRPVDQIEATQIWHARKLHEFEKGQRAKVSGPTASPATAPPEMTTPVTPMEKPTAVPVTEEPTGTAAAPAQVPPTSAYTGGRQTPEQITAGEEAVEARRKAVGEAITSARKATGEALRTGFGERKFKPEEATAARAKAASEAEESRRVSDLATIDRQIKQLADDAKDLRGRDWTRPGDLDRELQHLARRRHDLEERRKGLVR